MSERVTHWNYRMTRRAVEGGFVFEVREFYYSKDEKTLLWTEEPVSPAGETWTECGNTLAMMGRALGSLVFDLDTQTWLSVREAIGLKP